jgi:hypothetical protein
MVALPHTMDVITLASYHRYALGVAVVNVTFDLSVNTYLVG